MHSVVFPLRFVIVLFVCCFCFFPVVFSAKKHFRTKGTQTIFKMKKERLIKLLSNQFLTIATLASVVLGVIVGLTLRYTSDKWTERDIMYLNFIGELFLRMLKGLILPLVISSLIDAIGSLDLRSSGRIGVRAISYYMITTVMAVILGIFLVVTIRPGIDRNENVTLQSAQRNSSSKLRSATTVDTMLGSYPIRIFSRDFHLRQTFNQMFNVPVIKTVDRDIV